MDEDSRQARYLVIETKPWWFGEKVLVPPQWARRVSWGERKLYIDLSRRAIKASPKWDPSRSPERDYEELLYEHYGRRPPWNPAVSSSRSEAAAVSNHRHEHAKR